MNLLAISSSLKKIHYDIINRIAKNIFCQPVTIVDLKSYSPEISGGDAILLFGPRAKKHFKLNKYQNIHLILPAVIELEDESKNEKNREQTWKVLLKFKELLESSLTLTSSQLSELTANDISAIEIVLKSRGKTEWFGKTKSDKTICLSILPADKEKADIVLTFAELYAIKTAMEVLEVEEITIGTSGKRANNNNRS